MGKDQELLEAARNGNIPVVEKILSQRAKRSGPLASLRRGPGANVQDSSGYSALHHAALNGHKEVVQLLLAHEASTNIVDQKGSSPLHLAAWTGNVDIVRLLLCHGPSVPNVNLTTKDNETALHCAAQYGHTAVVAQLLEAACDPGIRNAREETALDLAAQYGRLEAVQLLVRAHPELVHPYSARGGGRARQFPHTPLHLASRNGHRAVVSVLLAAGTDVNVRTAGGTALHEAALCGKLEVVRALLDGGADLAIRDAQRNTVMDLLGQFPAHVTHDITAAIRSHRCGAAEAEDEGEDEDDGEEEGDGDTETEAEAVPPIPVPGDPALGSPYENVRCRPSPGTSPTHWHWLRHPQDASCGGDGGPAAEDADQLSVSSAASSTGGPSPRERAGSAGRPEPATGGIYVPMAPGAGRSPGSGSKVSPTPPKKPPRRNLSVSPTHVPADGPLSGSGSGSGPGPYEFLFLARTGDRRDPLRRGRSADQYVEMRGRAAAAAVADLADCFQAAAYENVPLRTQNPRRKLRRLRPDRGSEPPAEPVYQLVAPPPPPAPAQQPLSPTHYQQPPTPDHPPPSALHAERSIHERMRPLSQVRRPWIARVFGE